MFPFTCWKSTRAAGSARSRSQAEAATAPGRFPSDDAMAEFYESACARLAAQGYEHYEISNWALPGRRSRHNLKYWRREPYIGFGAGAHSFDGRTRWANVHDSARYVACIEQGISPREQIEGVTAGQALEEEFFLGLRQLEGIDLARIERDYDGELPGRVGELRNRIAASGIAGFDRTGWHAVAAFAGAAPGIQRSACGTAWLSCA